MLTFKDKILHLKKLLLSNDGTYADNYKTNILFYLDELNEENPKLRFLVGYNTLESIDLWLRNLLSQIVLKFDAKNEQLSDFISEHTLV